MISVMALPQKTKVIILVSVVVMAAGSLLLIFTLSPDPIRQPVKFNHKKHVQEVGLTCDFCHEFYKTETFAGIPNIEICQNCHTEDVSDSPEAKKVKGYVERGQQIPWVQMYHVRNHVRFSHRLHVAKEIACEECHGQTGAGSTPLRYRNFSDFDKTMGFCIACHKKRGASVDCNACHK